MGYSPYKRMKAIEFRKRIKIHTGAEKERMSGIGS
jgi:hypothetical protein